MANVSYVVPELRAMQPQYRTISDCVAGAEAVKKAGPLYLPRPNPADNSRENQARYEAYKARAVFYNATRRTLNGLTGQVFSRDPEITLPAQLEALRGDANGTGIGLVQLAKQATRTVLSHGRAGLHVDYPNLGPEGATIDQINAGIARPTLNYYGPTEIINWRVTTVGARDLLSLVVLREEYVVNDDGFEQKKQKRYRVLRLVGGIYVVEIYNDNNLNAPAERYVPTDANGDHFEEIPFTFIGIDNNDPEIDEPPMYDLATVNIAHYRNSADLEESCFIVGQPTPYFTGLTEEWVRDVFQDKVIELGSRAAISLPVGGQAGLLQATENNLVSKEMERKERQMVALGAKLVEQERVQRTAQEARLEAGSETSQLVSSAENVSAAFEFGLKMAARFQGTSDAITFKLNTEYELNTLTAEELKQVIASWQMNAISWTEMRTRLRFSGIASQDDAVARAEISSDVINNPYEPDRSAIDRDMRGNPDAE